MLGRNWQYQKTWTPEIAAAFFERLERCRTDEKRIDALLTQGRTLALNGDLGALDLVDAIEAIDDPWLEARAMLIRSYMHMRRSEWSDSSFGASVQLNENLNSSKGAIRMSVPTADWPMLPSAFRRIEVYGSRPPSFLSRPSRHLRTRDSHTTSM